MKIKEILQKTRTISCEFFPPKTAEGIPGVLRAVDQLKEFHPDFVSVTYGAGGSTRAFTEEITVRIKEDTGLEVMAHLTCVAQTREAVHGVLERLKGAGIDNVIGLRGDPPTGEMEFVPAEGGFAHASDLIEHIPWTLPPIWSMPNSRWKRVRTSSSLSFFTTTSTSLNS